MTLVNKLVHLSVKILHQLFFVYGKFNSYIIFYGLFCRVLSFINQFSAILVYLC